MKLIPRPRHPVLTILQEPSIPANLHLPAHAYHKLARSAAARSGVVVHPKFTPVGVSTWRKT